MTSRMVVLSALVLLFTFGGGDPPPSPNALGRMLQAGKTVHRSYLIWEMQFDLLYYLPFRMLLPYGAESDVEPNAKFRKNS